MHVGDIVTIWGKAGLWVLIRPAESAVPPGTRVLCREVRRNVEFIAGQGDLSLVARPELTPGMALDFNGRRITVAQIEGDNIKIATSAKSNRVPLPHGGHVAFGEGQATVPLAALVAQNWRTLIAEGD
ncbi:MAG: hypothetical protein KDJ72_01955 [Methyloceanibacter sp.]|uniref:hypothetical protein n=1 Tax=Methyloceanibacter sp. TaxID=1965321 RepID=UPI001DCC85F2|nr:hypothetical protein [Methyloceanibacter sp.]MCB1441759.1 hypothetical protein [Methyloceanibacter sp.]